MDTRESGPWIAAQVAGGLLRRGVHVRFAGVITTPGVAYLTRSGDFTAGVMISASHNPYRDNGIKVFGHSGFKLPDDEEHAVEQEIFRLLDAGVEPAESPLAPTHGLERRYLEFLVSTVAGSFAGMRIVVDCGNGAAFQLAPELFRHLGAEVHAICSEPNGRNINLNCGSLHVESLRAAVLEDRADLGVAFDGDADRAIFVAASGQIVDGDAVLLIAARALKAAGKLDGGTGGGHRDVEPGPGTGPPARRHPHAAHAGGRQVRAGGDGAGGRGAGRRAVRPRHLPPVRHHRRRLADRAAHLRDCPRRRRGLDELTAGLQIYPQRLVNIRVREKKALNELPAVAREIADCEQAFGSSGRVLVRFSGTEPLARVMVEGPDLARVEEFTGRIAAAIQKEIGA